VLASGAGTNLQALLDACEDPAYGARVVAVGADREGIAALDRAARHGVATFVHRVSDHPTRAAWDEAVAASVASYRPDLVVSAGFMRLAGPQCPGVHGARDALAHGVKLAGATLFLVDAGVDTGPIVAQVAVPVHDDDDEATLHERIKVEERRMLVDVVGRMAREGWTVTGRKVSIP
jgi:phosphoribosylglycinamide formyltransferase-1